MITRLPDEVIYNILVYTDPRHAYTISKTCTTMRDCVEVFYREYAPTLVRAGGGWHHCIKNKRTRTSLEREGQIISEAPMGVWSILSQRCVGCWKSFKAGVHKDFGIIAHAPCIRSYLINLFYFQKLGLKVEHFKTVPQCKLTGYYMTYGDQGQYDYITVWKDKTNGIVPYRWTAHFIVHQEQNQERTRQYKMEQELIRKAKMERPVRVRRLYNERIQNLAERMKGTMDKKQIRRVLKTRLPKKFLGDFFIMRDIPHDKFPDGIYDKAEYVIIHLERLLRELTEEDVERLKFPDLKRTCAEIIQDNVRKIVNNMVNTITYYNKNKTSLKQRHAYYSRLL